MQKHQQWLDNRSYVQHLECLKKIKSRKVNQQNSDSFNYNKCSGTSPGKNRQKITQNCNNVTTYNQQNLQISFTERPLKQNLIVNNQSQFLNNNNFSPNSQNVRLNFKSSFNAKSNKSPRQKFNVSLKQQQLLWDNFLLGKRIVQTTPVISKRKHDLQYKKHKQLLKSRINHYISRNSSNMRQNNAEQPKQFRIKKLQQHQQQIYQIQDEHRIQQKLFNKKSQTIFSLIIQGVNISKFKTGLHHFQNIKLTMKYGQSILCQPKTQNLLRKRFVQNTQCVDFQQLSFHQFFFILKKRKFQQNIPIVIQLKNVKSLNIIPIGSFSFQFNNSKQLLHEEARLFSFGKLIGTVVFSVHCGKKQQFKSFNS